MLLCCPSLKDILLESSSCRTILPREQQQNHGKKSPCRPRECRACDAGMINDQCMHNIVMNSMSCTESDEFMSENEGCPVRERLSGALKRRKDTCHQESMRGSHFRECHRALRSKPQFHPCHRTRIITTTSSRLTPRMIEERHQHRDNEARS